MNDILLLLAILPSIVLGKYVDNNDKFGKEPRGLLIKCFMGGIFAVILTILLSSILSIFVSTEKNTSDLIILLIQCMLEVALIEEFSKFFFLKKFTWKDKDFDHIYDAIVYAVFVSLGFATVENILYIFGGDSALQTALIRAILSVPGHAFFGVFMGYYYGIAKQLEINGEKANSKKYLFLSLLVPMLLHGIFDFCLYSGNNTILIVYILFVVFLYINAFSTVKKVSRISNNMK